MGYYFTTKSGSTYTVQQKPNSEFYQIEGSRFPHPLEIYPNNACFVGERWACQFTQNPDNDNFAGKTLRTSLVTSVRHINAIENNIEDYELE